MTPERWQQVDGIFQAAIELNPAERAAFLDKSCAGDQELRREVDSLITTDEQGLSLVNAPAYEVAAGLLLGATQELHEGQHIGHYQIVSLLGRGGMGEVYLAQDTKLGRQIALKLLPTEFTGNAERLRRFQQEARTVSALNHPNILTLHEIGHVEDRHFIATEFVDGETLRRRLRRSALSPGEAVEVAIQVASAVAAAHQAGIVHRDLKPENIMLRPDGYVKVLDFGLAKLAEQQEQIRSEILAGKPDVSSGLVMGTVKYMSPEQAQGQQVDSRSDLFSLGVVLYEMVAGRAPFEGKSASDLTAEILHGDPPPLTEYLANAPGQLQRIISRALCKDKDLRYQTVEDLLVGLKDLPESSTPKGLAHLIREIKQHRVVASLSLAVMVVAVAGISFGLYKYFKKGSGLPFQNRKMTRLTSTGLASRAAISPDGSYVAYWRNEAQKSSLWLKTIGTNNETQIVPPAEGRFRKPTFSPDGKSLYYSMVPPGTRLPSLFKLPLSGGNSTKLPQEHAFTISFSPDGKRFAYWLNDLAHGETSVVTANADGTDERKIFTRKAPDNFEEVGSWSPDGKMIACIGKSAAERYARLIAVDVQAGTEKPITSQKWNHLGDPVWLPDMRGLVMVGMEDTSSRQQVWFISYPDGEARRVTDDTHDYDPSVSLASDGSALVITETLEPSQIWTVTVQDEMSSPKGIVTLGSYPNLVRKISTNKDEGLSGLALTGDGRIVYPSERAGNNDIWIMDADGSNKKQLTTDTHQDWFPSVSTDAHYIVFESNRTGAGHIWRMDIDGGNEKQLTVGALESMGSISPDGNWVVYVTWVSNKATIWKMAIDGTGATQLTETASGWPRVSPDGKLIAYVFFDEKQSRKLMGIIRANGGKPIKTFDLTRGDMVRWAPNGQALTYLSVRDGIRNIWLQSLTGSEPIQLTDFKSDGVWSYAWSPDGKLLACARGTPTSDIVLLNDLR